MSIAPVQLLCAAPYPEVNPVCLDEAVIALRTATNQPPRSRM